jgi:hypothetical protein
MVVQALKDRIYDDTSNYATRWLAELPQVIWGLRIRSCTSYRCRFRSSTDPILRGRRGRANTTH